MAKLINSKQPAKFRVGYTVVVTKICRNVKNSDLKVGDKFTIAAGPFYYTDNGGMAATHYRHAFYRKDADEYKNIPQDALELVDKDMFDDLGPVGMAT